MNHFYQNINGWFDFQDIYLEMVQKANDNSHFVEIGCFLGKSTAFMGVEILNSGKKIKFDVIDSFEGNPESTVHKAILEGNGIFNSQQFHDKFTNNLFPVIESIHRVMKHFSYEVVDRYADRSLDFVFQDASHTYENLKRDLEDWFPKVKVGGYFGGHDYHEKSWPGVVKAVNEFFGEGKFQIRGNSWLIQKLQ
jgi:hypothetical protein